MIIRLILMVALTLTSLSVLAEDAEKPDPWAGKATLGYLATSGNTENSTLNTGFEISYTSGQWAHLLEAAAIKKGIEGSLLLDKESKKAYIDNFQTKRRAFEQGQNNTEAKSTPAPAPAPRGNNAK